MSKYERVAFCIASIPAGIFLIRVMAACFRDWRTYGSKGYMVIEFVTMATLMALTAIMIIVATA